MRSISVEVGAEDLDADRACGRRSMSMSMRSLIGIVQAFVVPGSCSASSISVDQLLAARCGRATTRRRRAAAASSGAQSTSTSAASRRHSDSRLQHDGRLHHRERRRVGGGLGAAGLAEDALDLGEATQDAVLRLQEAAAPRSTEMPGSVVGM